MNEEIMNEVREWIEHYDSHEEHDNDLCINLKDWAREILGEVVSEEEEK